MTASSLASQLLEDSGNHEHNDERIFIAERS